MALEFEVGNKIKSENYHIFDVETYEKKAPNGMVGNFVKLHTPDWCMALVFNQESGKFICVKEYRHGVDKVVTQLPCGTVEEGEDPQACCVRELCEEIGITKDAITKVELLEHGCPNPAFMNNTQYIYFVSLKEFKPKKQELDQFEFIEVVELTESELNTIMYKPDTAMMQKLAWWKHKFDNLVSW